MHLTVRSPIYVHTVSASALADVPIRAKVPPIHEAGNCKAPARWSCERSSNLVMEAIMAIGTVKFFNTQRGFGFVQPSDGAKDVFVHISAVERGGMSTLSEGQKVSYEVERGRDGRMSAVNLKAA